MDNADIALCNIFSRFLAFHIKKRDPIDQFKLF